jgi:hypothetical protein
MREFRDQFNHPSRITMKAWHKEMEFHLLSITTTVTSTL